MVCEVKRRSVISVVCVPVARLKRFILRSPRAWIGRQREGLRTPCREALCGRLVNPTGARSAGGWSGGVSCEGNPGLAALAVRTILLKFETSGLWNVCPLVPNTCGRLVTQLAPDLPALEWLRSVVEID